MSNTNGTTNVNAIAQEALVQLVAVLPVLKMIASDHSSQEAKQGSTITIHEVQAAAAVDFNPDVGYVASNRSMVDIPVTINKHKHHTYSVGVTEASSSSVDLIKRYAKTAAYSVGAAIVTDMIKLVTASNFANKTTKALGAGQDGFDRKTLLLSGSALSKRNVPAFDRFCLLNADYYASLFMDDSLMNMLTIAGQQVVNGVKMPVIHDFGISQFVGLESPANENLVGFCGSRTALGFATRIPDDPGINFPQNCKIETVTEDQSGISIQTREWYDATLGKFSRSYTLMYGVAKGQTDALQRIVSA